MAITYTQLANGTASFTPTLDAVWDTIDAFTDYSIPKSAVIEVLLENNNIGNPYNVGVRATGSGLARFVNIHEAEGGGNTHASMCVQLDADGKFEAYSSDVSRTTHHIVGYFEGVTFTEAYNSWTGTADDDAWHDKDLFTDYSTPKTRVCEIFCASFLVTSTQDAGVRINGSGIDRKISLAEAENGGCAGYGTFVKNDSDGVIEYYDDAAGNTVYYYLGYFDDAVDFTERADALDAAGDAGWEDEALSGYGVPASAVVEILCFNTEDGAENELGVREDGTAIDRKWDEHEEETVGTVNTGFRLCVTAGSDANRTIDIYEEDTSENALYHAGYFEDVAEEPADTVLVGNVIQKIVGLGLLS